MLAAGRAVGFHCKAGLGRTGTMLAAQLIWEGTDAATALSQVRTVEPGWVQSDRQALFLRQFEDWLQRQRSLVEAATR
jgi:atypical dual specificity phosphatase